MLPNEPENASPAQEASVLPESKDKQREFLGVGIQIGGSSIKDKITSEHITKSIELKFEQLKHHNDEHKREKANELIKFGIVALLILVAFFLFKDNSALLEKLIALFAGLLGGYGLGKSNLF